jgi:hypothetical protein
MVDPPRGADACMIGRCMTRYFNSVHNYTRLKHACQNDIYRKLIINFAKQPHYNKLVPIFCKANKPDATG